MTDNRDWSTATPPTGGEDEIASLRERAIEVEEDLDLCREGYAKLRQRAAELEAQLGQLADDHARLTEEKHRFFQRLVTTEGDRDAALARAERAERERDEAKALPRYQEYLAALARAEAAEALAYIGDLRFPDLTWKTRCEELVPDLRAAQARAEAAEARIATARREGWQAGAEAMRERSRIYIIQKLDQASGRWVPHQPVLLKISAYPTEREAMGVRNSCEYLRPGVRFRVACYVELPLPDDGGEG